MTIKPKYTTDKESSIPIIPRQFTDREELVSAFKKSLSLKKSKKNKIKFFYGVGGIGKTALKRRFCDILKTSYPDCIWNQINLEESIFRDSETALFQLRSNLSGIYKIDFPYFDVAYYYLIKKTRPYLISEISKKINFNSISDEISDIPNLEPSEISAKLPAYWAHDVKPFLNNKILVLFIDSYDEFLKDTYLLDTGLRQDEWIRELFLNLPEAKWIMFGREKLRWEEIDNEWKEHIDYHLIENFKDSDSKDFLESCKIKEKDVQSIIIEDSKGLPYYLDLAVDTYYEIKNIKKREPIAEDFAKTQQQVLVNFLKYLDTTEIYALKVLSVARFFDKDIFIFLTKKFKIAFPVLEMQKLFRFSFVKERMQAGNYDMNELMREGLQNIIDKELLKSVHKAMYEYYCKKFEKINAKDISNLEKQSLIEAFYHGKQALEPIEFSKWFTRTAKLFIDAAEHNILSALYEELYIYIENFLGKNHPEYANILNNLSFVYILQGKFNKAEERLYNALKIREQIFGNEDNEVANALNSIATLYSKQGKFKEEEDILKRALEIKVNIFGSEHFELIDTYGLFASLYNCLGKFEKAESFFKNTIMLYENKYDNNYFELGSLYNNLGMLYGKSARYNEAESMYLKAIEINKKNVGSEHGYSISVLDNLANLYLDMGKYSDAEDLYLKSLKMNEKTFGVNHPETAVILNNIGNLFLMQKNFDEAKQYYNKALEINEKIFGSQHPEVATASNNLGYLNCLMGNYELALPLFRKAYKIFRRKLGYNHLSISNIMGNVALVYRHRKNFDAAEKLLNKALKINVSILGSESQFVGETYKDFGELYEEKEDFSKSLEYYEKALPLLTKSFGDYHEEVTVISNKILELKAKVK
jgi:tetratricopeptide (TPR) repeat protein